MSVGAPSAVTIKEASQPQFVEQLFFKSYPHVQLPSPIGGLLERSTSCLSYSTKFGILFIAGQSNLIIVKADDVLQEQVKASLDHAKQFNFTDKGIPQLVVHNPAFGDSAPCHVEISNGDEFIALDTQKNGVPFVLIFQLQPFLSQGGKINPFCEFRVSNSVGGAKVTSVAWNPGDKMNNVLAICCDDGSLQIATVKGQMSVDVCSYRDSGVRSICWSPKGKQLVAGKMDGSLSQLKLDLTEAKKIPGPGGSRVPTRIFWTSTTQFLVNYLTEERDIDFVQVDLVKGSPPIFTVFGDIFVSDRVDKTSTCYFVPILPWNSIICASNTINEIVVIGKGFDQGNDNWIVADLNDNRRAALPIDMFAVGSALCTGYDSSIVFNDSEIYQPMPVLFLLSNSGILSSFTFVNSKPDATSMLQKASVQLPPNIFNSSTHVSTTGPDAIPVVPQTQSTPQPNAFSVPKFQLNSNMFGGKGFGGVELKKDALDFSAPSLSSFITSSPVPSTAPPPPVQQKPAVVSSEKSFIDLDLKSLPTGLPTLEQVEDLKRMVEEKRAQGALLASGDFESEAEDCDLMKLEIEKFQRKLENFLDNQKAARETANVKLKEMRKQFEDDVLTGLNIMEDFVAQMQKTTDVQLKEVDGLKERVIGHFNQLEYARSLAERKNDPQFVELLKAQPLDPITEQKSRKVEKLYQYIKNQLAECERFYKIQSQHPPPLNGAAVAQIIYQTLANHSRIIKKLSQDLNILRTQLGLRRCPRLDENFPVFDVPTMGHNYYEKKPLFKERPTPGYSRGMGQQSIPRLKYERTTIDDLTAGLTRIKLKNEINLNYPQKKPLKITADKLQVLRDAVSKTVEIDLTDKNYYIDPFDISIKNRAQSRSLIEKLDDKTIPQTMEDSVNVKLEIPPVTAASKPTSPSLSSLFPTSSATPSSSLSTTVLKSPSPVSPSVIPTVTASGTPSTIVSGRTVFGSPSTIQTGTASVTPPTIRSATTVIGSPSTLPTVTASVTPPTIRSASTLFGSSSTSPTVTASVTPSTFVSGSNIFGSSLTNPTVTASVIPSAFGSNIFGPSSSIPTTTVTASVTPSTFVSGSTAFGSSSPKPVATSSARSPSSFGSETTLFGSSSTNPTVTASVTPSAFGSRNTLFGSSSTNPTVTASVTPSAFGSRNTLFGSSSTNPTVTASVTPSAFGSESTLFGSSSASPTVTASVTPSAFGSESTLFGSSSTNPTVTASVIPSTFGSTLFGSSSTISTTTVTASVASSTIGSGSTAFGSSSPDPVLTTSVGTPSAFGSGSTLFGSSSTILTPTATVSVTPSTIGNGSTAFGSSSPNTVSTTSAGNHSTLGSLSTLFGSSSITPTPSASVTPSTFGSSSPNPVATTSAGTLSAFGSAVFGSPSTTQTVTASVTPSTFGSGSTLFGSSSTNPTVTASVTPSIFASGSTAFGSSSTNPTVTASVTPSIFGSGSTLFGSSSTNPTVTASVTPSTFGSGSTLFGSSSTNPTVTASVTPSAFGSGSTAFGSSMSNPVSTSVGTPSAFGSGNSIFGGAAVQQNASTFGALTPQQGTGFGTSAFGGAAVFGGTPAFGSGTSAFGSPFGTSSSNPAAAAGSTTSTFGSGGNNFDGTTVQPNAPAQSAPQQGTGFGTFALGGVFGGNSSFGGAPVFGGTPAFGSGTSAFGSAFGTSSPNTAAAASSTTSTFGSGSSIFGGASVQQNASTFGALAQSAPQQGTGFGAFGGSPQQTGSLFGGSQPSSPFGQQTQSSSPFGGSSGSAAPASFGSSAFSSWR